MKTILTTVAIAAVCGLSSMARAEEPSGALPDDRFVAKAATIASADLEMGRMAAERAAQADLKAFAQQMVHDHAAANVELLALAGRKKIPVPRTVDSKHQEVISRLSKLSGAVFDRAFASQMVDDNQQAVDLFRSESEHGTDPDLKSYATKVLPVVQRQLRVARELSGERASESKAEPARSRD